MKEIPAWLTKAASYIESQDFKNATIELTGSSNDQDPANDEVLGALVKLFSSGTKDTQAIQKILAQISEIYSQNNTDINKLKAALNALLATFGKGEGIPLEKQELGDLSTLTDRQIEQKIEAFRDGQQALLKMGKKPDEKIGANLKKLLDEQNKRAGNVQAVQTPQVATSGGDADSTGPLPEGAEDWFVVPTDAELKSRAHVYVVCGSPITTVLRNRYKMEFKLTKVPDTKPKPGAIVSADDDYAFKRERLKQQDFASNFADPSLVSDQDMCAQEISEEFSKPQYKKPQCIVIYGSTLVYKFEYGSLTDSSKDGKRDLTLTDNIAGTFAVCMNRREPQSGRPISDSYDIIEFTNNAPSFYFYSSKGVSSFSSNTLKSILLAIKVVSYSLEIPTPAAPGAEMTGQALTNFIEAFKRASQSSTAPVKAEAPVKTKAPTEDKATTEAAPSAKTEMPVEPKAADTQLTDESKKKSDRQSNPKINKMKAEADNEAGTIPAQDQTPNTNEEASATPDEGITEPDKTMGTQEAQENDLIADELDDQDDQSSTAEPEAEPWFDAKAELAAEPEVRAESEVAKAEPEIETASVTKPEAEAESKPLAAPEIKPEAKIKPEAETESETNSSAVIDAATDRHGEVVGADESETEAEPKLTPETKLSFESEPGPGTKPEAESKSDTEPAAETETPAEAPESTLYSEAYASPDDSAASADLENDLEFEQATLDQDDSPALLELTKRVDAIEEIIINNVKTLDALEARIAKLEVAVNSKGKTSRTDAKADEKQALKKMADTIKKSLADKADKK